MIALDFVAALGAQKRQLFERLHPFGAHFLVEIVCEAYYGGDYAASSLSVAISRTNERSILMASIGKRLR